MEVHTLHALSDNFMYLLVDTASKRAACVDPVDADEMVAAAARLGVIPSLVLTTHHHYDHAGGNDAMKRLVPGIVVCGGKGEGAQGVTREVSDGETLKLGEAVTIEALHTPAHTNGHTSYVAQVARATGSATPAAFTGDALFVGGCGRFFEGGPEDMCVTMRKLRSLPPQTKVYPGHEYTLKNLEFALAVEPDNEATRRKMRWAHEQREAERPTVPSTVHDELTFNPFMRVADHTVRAFCDGASDDVTCMRRLRNKKDTYAGSSRPWIPGGGPLPGL